MSRLIDADALKSRLVNAVQLGVNLNYDIGVRIDHTPTIEERPTGEWIPIRRGERGYSAGGFRCSQCGTPDYGRGRTNYCSQCGAWMHGGKQNEQSKQ